MGGPDLTPVSAYVDINFDVCRFDVLLPAARARNFSHSGYELFPGLKRGILEVGPCIPNSNSNIRVGIRV